MLGIVLTAVVLSGAPLSDRAAVIIGQNHGGDAWEVLRHAEHDAERVRNTLLARGEFTFERVIWLADAQVDDLREAFASLAATPPDLLVVYYSGHADHEALRLGRERLSYADLRAAVRAVDARSTVVIVDACHAEALRRGKDMRAIPIEPVLAWRGQTSEGEILIGSSSYGERAFEDDGIGGSVFTHHFLTGLDGAADGPAKADGHITVIEAFDYADRMTRLSGHLRREGSQRPWIARDDVGDAPVLTFKREDMGTLEIPPGIGGRMLIRTQSLERARIDGEYDKPSEVPLTLWMAAGDYRVEVREGATGVRVQPVRIEKGRHTTVEKSLSAWELIPFSPGPERSKASAPLMVQANAGYQLASGWLRDAPPSHGAEVGLAASQGDWQIGVGLGWLGSSFQRSDFNLGPQLREDVRSDEARVLIHGGRVLHRRRWVVAAGGLEAGGSYVRQEVRATRHLIAHGSSIIANVRLSMAFRLIDDWSLFAMGRAGGRAYPSDAADDWRAVSALAVSLGILHQWQL